jgi:hypothetical protein
VPIIEKMTTEILAKTSESENSSLLSLPVTYVMFPCPAVHCVQVSCNMLQDYDYVLIQGKYRGKLQRFYIVVVEL